MTSQFPAPMRIGIVFILFGFTILSFHSCKSGKSLSSSKREIRHTGASTSAMHLYEILKQEDAYTWHTGKARIRATTPYARMSATLNLRMRRDSVIWGTIEKLGFEIVRIMIRPDSVFMIDRLNKEYTMEPLQDFLTEYNVSLGFHDLQNALIGQIVDIVPDEIKATTDSVFTILSVKDKYGMTAEHWISDTAPIRLLKSDLVDAGGRRLTIENGQWQLYDESREMPLSRVITFEDEEGVTVVEIDFSSIERNIPASIPFSIPEHYVRAR